MQRRVSSYHQKRFSKVVAKPRKDRQQDKQIQYIKQQIKPENKVLDIDSDIFVDNTGWYVIPASLMAEGTEYNTRVGRKIRAKSLFLRGQVKMNQGATATTVRMLAFWDRASGGAVPNPSDVMQTNNDLQSPLDVDNAGTRFICIADKTWDLSINGTTVRSFKIFRKLKQTVTFNGSSNTSGALNNGQVYFMFFCNETSASDKRAEVNFWSRFTYTDM